MVNIYNNANNRINEDEKLEKWNELKINLWLIILFMKIFFIVKFINQDLSNYF